MKVRADPDSGYFYSDIFKFPSRKYFYRDIQNEIILKAKTLAYLDEMDICLPSDIFFY